MLKTISFISISVQHVAVTYWPYLSDNFQQNQKQQSTVKRITQLSQNLMEKIKIIYENSMIGLMIGLSFFHLIPLANQQIKIVLNNQTTRYISSTFPYGSLTAVLTFVFVLANSNHFYHTNSTKKSPKIGNFRSRSEFEHQMLSNKKLKLRRRLAVQDFSTQIMISLPSILLTSCLAADNRFQIWFWCLITILFEKQNMCSYFARSYYASVLQKQQALKLIFAHLAVIITYLSTVIFIAMMFPIMNGILNGISCGIIIYDVMIQKLANNYEQKTQLFEKIAFFLSGILITCFIISS